MDREDKNFIKSNLLVVGAVILVFVILLIVISADAGQVPTVEGKSKDVWYATATPEPTPVVMESPMTPDELSCVSRVKRVRIKTDKPSVIKEQKSKKLIKDCPWSAQKQMQIKNICDKYHMSFALIMAMAYTESRYNAQAIGDDGQAHGAWQVHPRTWYKTISKLGYTSADMLKLLPAAETVCYIMRAHFKEYDNIYFALMAWNGGGDYAYSMIDAGNISQYADEIENRATKYEKRL